MSEISQTFTPTTNGNYAVKLSNVNCSVTSDCQSFSISDLKNIQNSIIEIFPNPTHGLFTINTNQLTISDISITNITGKSIMYIEPKNDENLIQINITNQPAGLYFIKIQTKNKIITKKIIKN